MDNLTLNNKYTPILPSEAELLDVFPEAKKVVVKLIKENYKIIEDIKEANMETFDRTLGRIYDTDMEDWQRELAVSIANFYCFELPLPRRIKLIRNRVSVITPREDINRLEGILRLHNLRAAMKDSPDEVNEVTIKVAKESPIENYLLEKLNHSGFVKCPFHNEKTASCKISRNRFHCFGCGADGDVIDWVQRTRGITFLEAVRALNNNQ